MKTVKKNFILIHILFLISLLLFFSFKYFRIKDLSTLFTTKVEKKEVPIFVIENSSLVKKDFNIKNGNERENIEEVLKILKKNHKETLNLEYIIRNLYISDEIYISIKIEKSSLNETTEPLFIYSIVNSINNEKRVKFINIGKEKLFRFLDEDTFFEKNRAFGEL